MTFADSDRLALQQKHKHYMYYSTLIIHFLPAVLMLFWLDLPGNMEEPKDVGKWEARTRTPKTCLSKTWRVAVAPTMLYTSPPLILYILHH
jgi:hypothetical protein